MTYGAGGGGEVGGRFPGTGRDGVPPLRRRGVRRSGNDAYLAQLPAGTLLDLVRDPGNEADPNAIQGLAAARLSTPPRNGTSSTR